MCGLATSGLDPFPKVLQFLHRGLALQGFQKTDNYVCFEFLDFWTKLTSGPRVLSQTLGISKKRKGENKFVPIGAKIGGAREARTPGAPGCILLWLRLAPPPAPRAGLCAHAQSCTMFPDLKSSQKSAAKQSEVKVG